MQLPDYKLVIDNPPQLVDTVCFLKVHCQNKSITYTEITCTAVGLAHIAVHAQNEDLYRRKSFINIFSYIY